MKSGIRRSLTYFKGFTLIELTIVIAIIAIFASIVIPQLANYKAKGFDADAKFDLQNAMLAQEAHREAWGTYADNKFALIEDYHLQISEGVVIPDTFRNPYNSYRMEAYHPDGTGVVYQINGPEGSIEAIER